MIVTVGKSREIAKIRKEVAAGQHRAAARRLQTLVAVDPTDDEAYQLLVQIHRQAGDAAGAGRWGFLTDHATPDEIAAFEQLHPSPWVRLRLLRWTGDPAQVPSRTGRDRLIALIRLADQMPPAGTGDGPDHPTPAAQRHPHVPAARAPMAMERVSAPPEAPLAPPPPPTEPGEQAAAPARGSAAVPSKRQLRKAARREERLRRRELRREVRASTWISLVMITILIALGVLGSLGAVHTIRSIIERLTALVVG
ncbi:MAG TPA: bacterial transcriptional activator domain-containing protein [Micromonosporaceae bacterium]|nr:bacterial transcriptional activator domain-containing protein [Micromonosporaceae bacterium]